MNVYAHVQYNGKHEKISMYCVSVHVALHVKNLATVGHSSSTRVAILKFHLWEVSERCDHMGRIIKVHLQTMLI